MSNSILSTRNLTVRFGLKGRKSLLAVDNANFDVQAGKTLGIVGESGSGKTTVALAVARLIPSMAEEIRIDGTAVHNLPEKALRNMRQQVQIIFQDPYSALNPRLRASEIVREPLKHTTNTTRQEQDSIIDELFEAVGLHPEQKQLFPHQFSGGQRQRIGIARALSTKPKLIICDEPVSALDVAVQAQILNLLKSLQKRYGLTYLFISHDLGVVQHMCDDIAVMYMGQIVEKACNADLFQNPKHPYTKALLAAVPSIHSKPDTLQTKRLTGELPDLTQPITACRFLSRCPLAHEKCTNASPELLQPTPNHSIACFADSS